MFKTLEEFDAFVARDNASLLEGKAPAGVCLCGHCKKPLQESVTGFRFLANEPACSDCYYADVGEFLAMAPVPGRRGSF